MRPSFTKDHLGEALELLRCPREASALVTAYVALASLHVSVRALEALVKQKVLLRSFATALSSSHVAEHLAPARITCCAHASDCDSRVDAIVAKMNQKLSKLQLLQRSIRQYAEQNNGVAKELSFSLGPNALADAKKRLSELEALLANACEATFRSCRVNITAGVVVPIAEDGVGSHHYGNNSQEILTDADATVKPFNHTEEDMSATHRKSDRDDYEVVFESPLKRSRTHDQMVDNRSKHVGSSLDDKIDEEEVEKKEEENKMSPSLRDCSETYPQHLESSFSDDHTVIGPGSTQSKTHVGECVNTNRYSQTSSIQTPISNLSGSVARTGDSAGSVQSMKHSPLIVENDPSPLPHSAESQQGSTTNATLHTRTGVSSFANAPSTPIARLPEYFDES